MGEAEAGPAVDPTGPSENGGVTTNLVRKLSYMFLRQKGRRSEDATDICDIEKNGNIVAVSACKQSTECGNNCFWSAENRKDRHFKYVIVEPFGDEIVAVEGRNTAFPCGPGTKISAELTREGQRLGYVTFSGEDNSYVICNNDNVVLFAIQSPAKDTISWCPCTLLISGKVFKVFLPDGTLVGEIGDEWDAHAPYHTGKQFGFSFPEDLSNEQQWMLLGASLVIRWQFWRPLNNSVWCLAQLIVILLILVLIISLICTLAIS